VVAIGYGILQAVLGINESTVPPDIWPLLEGVGQYEDLGRHPFTFLTPNGMAAVSIFPVVLLFGFGRRSVVGTTVTILLALLIGVLTLTRSYLLILGLLLLLLRPLQRTSIAIWLSTVGALALGAVVALRAIDPKLLSLSLRLEGDVSSERADIWAYTISHLDASGWLLGMGFGSGVWERFFAPMTLYKDLQSPHSVVLEVTGQFGIVGLVVYLALGVTVLRAYAANRSNPVVSAVALATMLVMARELLAASYVFSPSILGAYFWTLFGMVLAQLPARRISESPVALSRVT
jgi:O-antigen ligase